MSVAATVFMVAGAVNVLPRAAVAADYTLPINAMFYYDESFTHTGASVPNDHHPQTVPVDSDNPTRVALDVVGMQKLGMAAAIASWWGPNQHVEQTRFPILYGVSLAHHFGVIPYYEKEGYGDPGVAEIRSDLAYLAAYDAAIPGAQVHIGGKPVIFVYNAGATGCAEVTKWKQATNGFTDWYVNMKVFGGFRDCADQPSSWHQYGPAQAESIHLPYSFNISPGFWHRNEATPRLARDPARWVQNVAHLKASTAQWHLVTSWNEGSEDTIVAPSPAWQSSSGWGFYADELRRQLVDNGPAPSPSPSPTGTPSPSPTGSPTPSPTATTPSPSPTTPSPSPTGTPPGSVTVMAAGDIVEQPPCNGYSSGCQDGWTAELITKYQPSAVLALGDLQYEQGSPSQYAAGWGRTTCAAPSDCDAWGKHLGVMYPAPGNHEWLTANAQGYRDYFGARLAQIGSDTPSPNPQLYYSYDLGGWHFVALDSDCSPVGGCGANRPMTNWLIADLAANNGRPTIVYYHHATWSSGSHGSRSDHEELKRIVYADRDVQIVLNGHDHNYERFAPMGQSGPDPTGARYFVVGTGGKGPTCGSSRIPGSQAYNCTTMGMLRLQLTGTGYSWQYHPVGGVGEVGGPPTTFTDSGSSGLRGAASPSPTPSASPTASASPSPASTGLCLDALRRADRCGWPTAATTGPRSPVVLTTYTGPLPLVIPAGQTRSGLIVPGCVRLQTGAALVDSIVRPTASTLCGGYAAVDQEWSSIQQNVALRYVEVDLHLAGPNRMNLRAITGSGFELDHVECWGGADCVHYGAYVSIHDSYLHTPPCLSVQSASVCRGLHIDALHSASSPVLGASVLIERNTIVAEESTPTNYATSAWINGPAIPPYTGFVQSNVHGINNLLAGGGYTVYCEAHTEQASSVPMVEFRGNRISDLYYPNGGYWGATTGCKNNVPTYSGNTYDRTGVPL